MTSKHIVNGYALKPNNTLPVHLLCHLTWVSDKKYHRKYNFPFYHTIKTIINGRRKTIRVYKHSTMYGEYGECMRVYTHSTMYGECMRVYKHSTMYGEYGECMRVTRTLQCMVNMVNV